MIRTYLSVTRGKVKRHPLTRLRDPARLRMLVEVWHQASCSCTCFEARSFVSCLKAASGEVAQYQGTTARSSLTFPTTRPASPFCEEPASSASRAVQSVKGSECPLTWGGTAHGVSGSSGGGRGASYLATERFARDGETVESIHRKRLCLGQGRREDGKEML